MCTHAHIYTVHTRMHTLEYVLRYICAYTHIHNSHTSLSYTHVGVDILSVLLNLYPPVQLVMSLVEVTDINTKDGDGWTPLMFACKGSSQFMVRYLLQRGADPNIPQVLFSGICTYVHVHNSTTH